VLPAKVSVRKEKSWTKEMVKYTVFRRRPPKNPIDMDFEDVSSLLGKIAKKQSEECGFC